MMMLKVTHVIVANRNFLMPSFLNLYSTSQITAVCLLFLGTLVNGFFIDYLKINNLGFLVFLTAWLMLPYIVCFIRVIRVRRKFLLSAFFTVFITLLLLTDIVLINPDPQGGLGILMIPFFQAVAVSLGIFFSHIFVLIKSKR